MSNLLRRAGERARPMERAHTRSSGAGLKLVDRLIWRELFGPLVNSILMFLMVLFAAANLFTLTNLLANGVPFLTVARMAVFSLPMLVSQTLPMGMLLGCLLAFGRLSGDSEHIALFAGGISFYRVVVPIAWVGLILSVIGFTWDETVSPAATREFLVLKKEVTQGLVTSGKPLTYNVMKGDRVDEFVYVDSGYDSKTHSFRNVTIVKMSDAADRQGRPDVLIEADRAWPLSDNPNGLDWKYEGVRILDLRPDPKNVFEAHSNELTTESLRKTVGAAVGMNKTFKGVIQSEQRDNRSMTFRELSDRIKQEQAAGDQNVGADEVDLWGKVSTPLASLVFGLVGAPLGIRPQRGSKAMGFGVAIGIIFLYWVAYNWLYTIGKSGGLPPLAASFAPNAIGLIAGIILVARTRQ